MKIKRLIRLMKTVLLPAVIIMIPCAVGTVQVSGADAEAIEAADADQIAMEDSEVQALEFVDDKPAVWDSYDEGRLQYDPSSDWDDVNVQITGTYNTLPAEEILEQINGYRREACEEGLMWDGRPLTMEDYHPLKWSRALEESVRIRAMENKA